jgi:hypothetical protein
MTRLIPLVALFGCLDTSGPTTEVDCAALTGGVTGQVLQGPTEDAVEADVLVTGHLAHLDGLSIRYLTVAGVSATDDGFNYDSWSATVPYATLVALADDTSSVTVDVVAVDACDATYTVSSFPVMVNLTPDVSITSLDVALELPGSASYLPPDDITPAIVKIVGDDDAAGAVVQLEATHGRFVGGDGENAVVLTGSQGFGARATVLYYADTAGTILITATAEGLVEVATVAVAGPPTLVPPSAELGPGDKVDVAVFTDGAVTQCTASFTSDMTAVSGGVDLMTFAAANDSNADGRIDFTVSAETGLLDAQEVRVTCEDLFGQSVVGSYVGIPDEVDTGF